MGEDVYNNIISSYNLIYNNLNILECGSSDLGLDTKSFRENNNCYYIEAVPESFEYFLKNASNINIDNVFNYALFDKCGEIDFTLTSHGGNSSYCHLEDHMYELTHIHNSQFKTIKVKTITYKYFIENIIKKNIDILILDVEGCEVLLLNSFKNLSPNQLPKIICIECGYDWEERKKILLELGYTLDFYGSNNCYASIGEISKNMDVIRNINLNNKSFVWYGKELYSNDLLNFNSLNNILNIECSHHMGDNFINFMFFTKIKDFIEDNNIIINYYCWEQYHNNLKDFNPSSNINIHSLSEPYQKTYYELWQGGRTKTLTPVDSSKNIEDQLVYMFNLFLTDFNFNISVDSWYYENLNIKKWFDDLPIKYKDIEVLIVNSSPRSGQYNYNKDKWDKEIIELSKKYKIATTEFVSDDIINLSDFNLKDITAISINVDYIIGINTGPLLPLFNTYTLERVKNIYIFGGSFKHPKTICNLPNITSCNL
jgi:FkbM family methyltransferase